jgi:hypothetical protein
MTITFETLQERLLKVLGEAEVKVGSKQGKLLEAVYVQALRDSGIKISATIDMMLMCGRSVAGYNPPTKEVLDKYRNAQLGYDHGEDVEELEETN